MKKIIVQLKAIKIRLFNMTVFENEARQTGFWKMIFDDSDFQIFTYSNTFTENE